MNDKFSALRKDGYQVSPAAARKGFEAIYASVLGDMALHRDFKVKDIKGANPTELTRAALLMKDLGILRSTLEYGTSTNGLTSGRHFHSQLLMFRADALPLFDAALVHLDKQKREHQMEGAKLGAKSRAENRRAKSTVTVESAPDDVQMNGFQTEPHHPGLPAEPVALAKREDEVVRAVAGPDAPSPFKVLTPLRRDEAVALIEAADQYLNRTTVLGEQFEKLQTAAAALGITLDFDKLLEGAQFNRDERLEHVALLVPHIKGLNAAIERLSGQVAQQRADVAEFEKVRRERDRLAGRLRDLTSQRVLDQQRQAAAQA